LYPIKRIISVINEDD
jgi:hypothetical protein